MYFSSKILTICFLSVFVSFSGVIAAPQNDDGFRILHVMSYHSSWKWNRDQFQGFKSALEGADVEYQVVELDTKRNSKPSEIEKKVNAAKQLIQDWKPDLLYVNDDNAQKYFALHYVNTDIPIVFSGVNRDPSEYNYLNAANVTGVLEQEHIVPTFRLLLKLAPDIKRVAVIVDADPTWKGVMGRIRSSIRQIPGVEITQWVLVKDLSQFQQKIIDLQDQVDAIAMLGVFNIKDDSGNDVDYELIQRWVADNSKLPDFSFWETRIERGTLCAVAVSGYEQGFLAGKKARSILLDGTPPNEIPVQPSRDGTPMVNLSRARDIGIKPDVNLLLNIKVFSDYVWDP